MKAKTLRHENVEGQIDQYLVLENEQTGKRFAMKLAESTIKKIQEVENDVKQAELQLKDEKKK